MSKSKIVKISPIKLENYQDGKNNTITIHCENGWLIYKEFGVFRRVIENEELGIKEKEQGELFKIEQIKISAINGVRLRYMNDHKSYELEISNGAISICIVFTDKEEAMTLQNCVNEWLSKYSSK
ncbi:MAG: hypothetical protein ACPGXZ_06055 [Saprospiraceae bacterium]